MLQHLMNMFKLSSEQHCTTNSRKVVIFNKDLIGMNFSYIEQPNLVTQGNLEMQFTNMPLALPS